MATVQLIDDLDGSVLEDGSTVHWGLDGREYELDTSPANEAMLRKQLDKYLRASRRVAVAAPSQPVGGVRGQSDTHQLQAVRDWARRNGHEVSDRGRVPKDVMAAFDAAH
ncbi:histone-like nucleoid-structuring protein Lsr2 [Rhodococcoides corynebacterioides]|uniref:histone-like nucleoid-structuring protein Lsr2 n=1 Tax=Rhodococcoides corynebacterioides TaxID=53972 RepID=UPI001C9A2E6C|nr:Lsr2 family protein [Rhodococcus corynebacterioides]MBY6349826.1 Lsr2 family protein [Rhodococcus corynebacterioides]